MTKLRSLGSAGNELARLGLPARGRNARCAHGSRHTLPGVCRESREAVAAECTAKRDKKTRPSQRRSLWPKRVLEDSGGAFHAPPHFFCSRRQCNSGVKAPFFESRLERLSEASLLRQL